MIEAWHLALKDLRLLARDRMALFWAAVFPVLFALFIGSVLSSSVARDDAKLGVVVVDQAGTEASRALVRALEETGTLRLRSGERALAERSVQKGEAVAYLRIPSGFGNDPRAIPELGSDPSRASEASWVRTTVNAALAGGASTALSEVSVIGTTRPRSAFDLVFPAAVLWGLMGCAATFAVAMVSERTAGTFIRLRAAPIRRVHVLAGKALAAAVLCLADAALLLTIARFGFDVGIERPGALLFALVSVTGCFVGLTIFLSTLGKSEQSVSGAGWATLLLMAMLGGAMVPVSFMPEWMQRLSDVSPVKWGILALEGALWRGLSLSELARPCAVLLAVGALGFGLGVAAMRRREA